MPILEVERFAQIYDVLHVAIERRLLLGRELSAFDPVHEVSNVVSDLVHLGAELGTL